MSEKLYAIKESTMVAIAASIRDVAGITESINGDEISGYVTTTLPTAILSNLDEVLEDQDDIIAQIQTALEGKASATPTLQAKTVTPSTSVQTVTPDSNYDGLSKVTVNAMPTATQATPSISVSSSGLITASATQTAGYVSAGTKSDTEQLTTQAAKTITPSTSSQTAVASGRYTTGAVTVAGDANLKAENIAEGVSIFGVTGTHSGGSSGGGNIETCTVTISAGTSSGDTSSGIVSEFHYTAYVDGNICTKTVTPTVAGPVTVTDVVKNTTISLATMQNRTENVTLLGTSYYSPYVYRIDADNATMAYYPCFLYGTKILLHNGASKEVQDINYNDILMVWDFDNGCFTSAKPLWIKQEETVSYYYHCIFENGTILDLVGSNGNCHAVYCVDDNRFEYANKCVGKKIMTRSGITKLLSCELKHEIVKFYNIVTDYHFNCYANEVLTSTKLNNIYPIKDMKFIKEERPIVPMEKYDGVSKEFYIGLRLAERAESDIGWVTENIQKKLERMKPKEVK